MKLGFIAENSLDGLKKDAAFAADYGFEGLEFNYWGNFKDVTKDEVEQMRSILDEAGVKAASLGVWGWNHLSPDEGERREAHKQLDRAIEFASILGAEVLITGGGQIPDASLDEQAAAFAEMFPPFLERAEAAGLTVAIYPIHGASFFISVEAFEKVWERGVDVGIKFDPANWRHAGLDYLTVLREHGDRVTHMHVKEHLYMDGELVSQPAAGMGDIEWGKIFAFLYEHGYDGWLIMEPHGPLWSKPPLRQTMLLLSQRLVQQFLL